MEKLKPIIALLMFAALLKLLGCSSPKKKEEDKLPQELREKLDKSIEAFQNRPIHKVLTSEIIDTTSDDELLQVVFDNLSEKLPDDYEKEYGSVIKWNKSRQAIYMIWWLEGEVNNGGFNQYYANSSGQYYKLLPEALQLVGAVKFAEITQQANDTYEKENEKITKHQDGTLEGFSKSYKDNPLNDFDDKFYELAKIENLHELQVRYIRKHKVDFVDVK